MGITHFRIDDRLIHGQIITVWVQNVGCDEIVVADDEASSDTLQISLFKMAVPRSISLKILSLKKAVVYLKQEDFKKILLITRNLENVVELKNLGLPFEEVTIGNISPMNDRKKYSKSVWLNNQDKKNIQTLLDQKIKLHIQVVPTERRTEIHEALFDR